MTQTTAKPPSIPDMAGWPATEADASAYTILRALRVYAQVYVQRMHVTNAPGEGVLLAAAAGFAINSAQLLARLLEVDPAAADEQARLIWHATDDPSGPTELLWEALAGYDPQLPQLIVDEVRRLERAEAKRKADADAEDDAARASGVLPEGGTVADLRRLIAKGAAVGDKAFGKLSDAFVAKEGHPPLLFVAEPGDRAADPVYLAHLAAFGGWSTVKLLKHIEQTYGPGAAYDAACLVQDLAVNGDDGDTLGGDLTPEEIEAVYGRTDR